MWIVGRFSGRLTAGLSGIGARFESNWMLGLGGAMRRWFGMLQESEMRGGCQVRDMIGVVVPTLGGGGRRRVTWLSEALHQPGRRWTRVGCPLLTLLPTQRSQHTPVRSLSPPAPLPPPLSNVDSSSYLLISFYPLWIFWCDAVM